MLRIYWCVVVAVLVPGCGSPITDASGERIMTDAKHTHYHVHGPDTDHGHAHTDFSAGGHTHEHDGH